MAEETTEEALFYDDATSLNFTSYHSYTGSSQIKEEIEYLALKKRVEDKMAKGEPIYCQILDDRRAGSVGRIQAITFDYRPATPPNPQNHSWYNRGVGAYLGIIGIEVVWDKRKNIVKPYFNEVELLENWNPTDGTIWKWTQGVKEKVEPIKAYDHLDQEIQVGQNVCFVHRKYGNISMMFGTVSRITDKGGVFIKRLKLRDNDRVDEYRALDMDDVIIIDNTLLSRLMMARLSAQ